MRGYDESELIRRWGRGGWTVLFYFSHFSNAPSVHSHNSVPNLTSPAVLSTFVSFPKGS